MNTATTKALPASLDYHGKAIRTRDGEMVNATDMWKAAGGDPSKAPAKWLSQDGTAQFSAYLTDILLKDVGDLTKKERGGDAGGGATWMHWQLGMAYAKYLSPEFHAWCNGVIRAVMAGDIVPAQAPNQVAVAVDFALLAKSISDGIREGLAPVIPRLESVETGLGKVETRLDSFETQLQRVCKRRSASDKTKREAFAAIHACGGRCPACLRTVIVDDAGNPLPNAELDHFYAVDRPEPNAVWPVCQDCHKTFTHKGRDGYRPAFDAYQQRRKSHCGPLFNN